MADIQPIRRALISVFDKTGLAPLCEALGKAGVEILSTGGTAKFIEEKAGITPTLVESVTDFPEMMEGRVKTLHPRVFGGILARRNQSNDVQEAQKHGAPLVDLVIVNLYPFWEHTDASVDIQASYVDIGGPSLLRAAAKNFASVVVLSSPEDYSGFLESFQKHDGGTDLNYRHSAAARTFGRTSQYDSLISTTWGQSPFPATLTLSPQETLRYGENPHQKAVWSGEKAWSVLQGKALSYNNLLDTQAAVALTQEFTKPAVAIIKHNNPCGVACGGGPLSGIFEKAWSGDSKSAFGGIVSTNRPIDGTMAEKLSSLFLEVIIAPEFDEAARATLSAKKNLRLIEWKKPLSPPFEARPALGGWLLQSYDSTGNSVEFQTVTKSLIRSEELEDIKFAWNVVKHVRSNAIVLAKDQKTIGIGAGQMSRVDAVELAIKKSEDHSLEGAVLASDAFFPFRDNIDLLKGSGIRAIVQPGGSKRDNEVIEACNEHGLSMVFTGQRHFKH